MSEKFISIGESLHASIAKHARAIRELLEMGSGAYTAPSEPLDYIKNLIESQVDQGADFIAINVDDLGEDDPQITVDQMVEYVKLVHKWSKGVPVCIDSSDDNALKAGLEQWYSSDGVKPPLLNSVKVNTIDNIMPLKNDYDFSFVGILMGQAGGAVHGVDGLYNLAEQLFEAAKKYGFGNDQIYFDPMIFPLAIDMPMQPGEPSYTYKTFQTIKKIKETPEMAGVHFTGGITNCARDLPCRKVGIMRAFVHLGMSYGLDSGVVNVKNHLETGEADTELLKLVSAYAAMDGDADKMTEGMMLMGQFCQQSRTN